MIDSKESIMAVAFVSINPLLVEELGLTLRHGIWLLLLMSFNPLVIGALGLTVALNAVGAGTMLF